MADTMEYLRILDVCLDRTLKSGEPVEACLRDYPDQARELESALRLALQAQQAGVYTPATTAKALARATLHQAMRRREAAKRQLWWRSLQWFAPKTVAAHRWAAVAVASALFVVLATSGAVAASSGSDPDEALYPIKRTVERTRLAITRGPEAKASLHADFADRRMEELAAMASKGDRRRMEAMRREFRDSLEHVRVFVLPGNIVVVARPGGPGHEPMPGTRPRSGPGSGNDMRELQRALEAHARHAELRYRMAMQQAPPPVREELRTAMEAARQEYAALLAAFEAMEAQGADSR
ncbi:MAG: hypothetical protein HY681_13145 [Chloroflexi bacterium]|nr:hypothetical protein [Chloroflexota bacterium]